MRPPVTALPLLLLLFVLLATALSAVIPLGEAADEVSHHSYVRYVAEYGGLPPVVPGTTVLGETFQPPLYYALAAPLTAWLPRGPESNLGFRNPVENNPDWRLGDPSRARVLLQPAPARWPWRGEALGWHLVRLLSVALGVGTLFATYRLAALVFPDEPWTPLLAAALVAFLPTFLALSAAVTNDTLATTLGALLLWQLAHLVVEPGTHERRRWLVVGFLGGLGVWTKASGWVFVGTVLLAAALRVMVVAQRQAATGSRPFRPLAGRPPAGTRSDFGETASAQADAQPRFPPKGDLPAIAGPRVALTLLPSVAAGVATAGLAWLLVVLPLWGLNLRRAGDLLGRGVQAQVTEARGALTLAELWGLLQGLYRSWWAGFGGAVHLHFPAWVNAGLLLPLLLAGAGLLHRHLRRAQAPRPTRALMGFLAGHTLLVLAAWLLWSSLVMGTGQGRLLFPALPAIATLLAGGLVGLFPATFWQKRGPALGWSIAALALALAALGTLVWPVYRARPVAAEAPPAAEQTRWQVGALPLHLTAFYFPLTIDDRPVAGDESALFLAWESSAPLPDVRLRLRWVDRDGTSRWVKEGSPIAAPPLTDEWEPGRYAAWHHILIPEGEPGWYRLMVSVIDPATGEPLPLQAPDGGSGPEIMVGQTTVVAP